MGWVGQTDKDMAWKQGRWAKYISGDVAGGEGWAG